MCFAPFLGLLVGVSGGVGIVFILCIRYMAGIGESVGYFSGHYYGGMYIILDFRNIFLDIQL